MIVVVLRLHGGSWSVPVGGRWSDRREADAVAWARKCVSAGVSDAAVVWKVRTDVHSGAPLPPASCDAPRAVVLARGGDADAAGAAAASIRARGWERVKNPAARWIVAYWPTGSGGFRERGAKIRKATITAPTRQAAEAFARSQRWEVSSIAPAAKTIRKSNPAPRIDAAGGVLRVQVNYDAPAAPGQIGTGARAAARAARGAVATAAKKTAKKAAKKTAKKAAKKTAKKRGA